MAFFQEVFGCVPEAPAPTAYFQQGWGVGLGGNNAPNSRQFRREFRQFRHSCPEGWCGEAGFSKVARSPPPPALTPTLSRRERVRPPRARAPAARPSLSLPQRGRGLSECHLRSPRQEPRRFCKVSRGERFEVLGGRLGVVEAVDAGGVAGEDKFEAPEGRIDFGAARRALVARRLRAP